MSRMDCCRLEEPFSGRLIVRLTMQEALSMVDEGTARRTGRQTFSHIKPVVPSNSSESAPMLHRYDMNVVAAGVAPTECEFERLQGWGFHVKRPPLEAQLAR